MVEDPEAELAGNTLLLSRRIKDTEHMYSLTFDRGSVVVLVDNMESMVDEENRMI